MSEKQNMAAFKATRNPYLVQTVKTASKDKLILMLYELGAQCCANQNREKASRVLTELIAALDFQHQEIAIAFFDIYKYALDQVNRSHFGSAGNVFRELAAVWKSQVLQN